MTGLSDGKTRQRVSAAERREALIEAAIEEFAETGLHGTPVDRIARRVGVAQPYVFSLFPTKRDLFIAAVERCFERVTELFVNVARNFDPEAAEPGVDVLMAMGQTYKGLLVNDQTLLRLQMHSYAACNDEQIREHTRAAFARFLLAVQRASGVDAERIDEFIRYGMWLNVAAALGVDTLSPDHGWVSEQMLRDAKREAEGA